MWPEENTCHCWVVLFRVTLQRLGHFLSSLSFPVLLIHCLIWNLSVYHVLSESWSNPGNCQETHFDQIHVMVNKPVLLHWSWKWETPRWEFSLWQRRWTCLIFVPPLLLYHWSIVATIQRQQRNSIYTMEVPCILCNIFLLLIIWQSFNRQILFQKLRVVVSLDVFGIWSLLWLLESFCCGFQMLVTIYHGELWRVESNGVFPIAKCHEVHRNDHHHPSKVHSSLQKTTSRKFKSFLQKIAMYALNLPSHAVLDTKIIREGCLYEVGQPLSTNFWEGCLYEVGQTLSTKFWVLLYAFFFHYFLKGFLLFQVSIYKRLV